LLRACSGYINPAPPQLNFFFFYHNEAKHQIMAELLEELTRLIALHEAKNFDPTVAKSLRETAQSKKCKSVTNLVGGG
jgi:hypothetical protein